MSKELQKNIDRFVDYFREQVAEIQLLKTEHGELYRKLLYVTVLDTLAKSVYPRRSNKERFVYFVKRFCRWTNCEKVSLVHLIQLLRKNPDPVFEKLRKWALEKFKELPVHRKQLMPICHDPNFDEVKRHWPAQKEHREPLEGVDLQSLQHCYLLYAHRNSLVHELRIPGYGVEFGDDEEPFYHIRSPLTEVNGLDETTVELVYPWRFFHSLCEESLSHLKKYFLKNELNPYESFTLGTYWIMELNL